jgi:hypothetical protein
VQHDPACRQTKKSLGAEGAQHNPPGRCEARPAGKTQKRSAEGAQHNSPGCCEARPGDLGSKSHEALKARNNSRHTTSCTRPSPISLSADLFGGPTPYTLSGTRHKLSSSERSCSNLHKFKNHQARYCLPVSHGLRVKHL